MTSSVDPRRTAPSGASPRKRVAGARRRQQPTSTPASTSTPVVGPGVAPSAPWLPSLSAPVSGRTATATLERPAADPLLDEQPAVGASDTQIPLDEEDREPSHPGATSGPSPRRRSGRLWVPVVAATAALALLVGVLVYALRPSVSEADRTAAVSSARTTLESLLSYSGSSFDKHVDEVLPELTSPFKDQFSKVAATDIKPMAVKNEATVQAKVYEAGVMDTSGDGGEGTTVRVMAFVNQATTTKAQPTPAIDQNRVIATMRKTGDRWLISDLSAY